MRKHFSYSPLQLTGLVVLRVLIGWYFLYEGITKFLSPNWSAYGYLMDSKGPLGQFFMWLADMPLVMTVINYLNIYGLILVGLSLLLGIFSRLGSIGAATMLVLYYFSHPPTLDAVYALRPEGSYLWIDKNVIILVAVVVTGLLFPNSHRIGIDRYIYKKRKA
ncbi:MAG: DoxX family membrane protein [Paludibacter sp.]|jgi:thiosulfate dehydrogenase [quinone] large subunit|nr:DoxX family membrane protein [Paludibacter sp.]